MRFTDVDQQELNPALVLLINCVEGADLRPKGRSSITAEDQGDWSLAFEAGETDLLFGVQIVQLKIGGWIARRKLPLTVPHGS
jgi:hypothetical protein